MSNIIIFPNEYVRKSNGSNVFKPVKDPNQKIMQSAIEVIQVLRKAGYTDKQIKSIFKCGGGILGDD